MKRDRKRPPEKLYWWDRWDKSRPLTALAAVLFTRTEQQLIKRLRAHPERRKDEPESAAGT